MTKILLIRHGHVERPRRPPAHPPGNGRSARRCRPRRVRLETRQGLHQPARAARVATGAEIATACKLPVEILDDLVDIDYGGWQWKACEEAEANDPSLYRAWRTTPQLVRFPEGDSLQDLVARTADALRLVVRRHGPDTVVLVGHDSVNRARLLQLLEQPLSCYWRLAQAPCCINEIEMVEGRIQVHRMNETHHLDALRG